MNLNKNYSFKELMGIKKYEKGGSLEENAVLKPYIDETLIRIKTYKGSTWVNVKINAHGNRRTGLSDLIAILTELKKLGFKESFDFQYKTGYYDSIQDEELSFYKP